jgi:Na+/H+-translocating membrane pyrophosphatase
MDNTAVSKRSVTFGLALAVACVINALIVVVKEKNDAVMNGMKKITGHHWITHTIVVLAVFVIVALVLGRKNCGRGPEITADRLIKTVVSGVVVAGLIIIGFYLIAD